jgi:quercetin dioxygenase-like cupin family protein
LAAFILVVPLAASAQDSKEAAGVTWEELTKTTTNAVGEPITYPTGTPEIQVEVGTFEPGGQTSLHQHPVPIVVYILEGELEVRVEGAEPYRVAAGQAIVEPQNKPMQAFNLGDVPAKLLVVALAAEGQPTAEALTD